MKSIDEIFNKQRMDNKDFHNYIKDKNVVIILPGSNFLYEPDVGNFINGFDVIVGVNNIYKIQKKYYKYLGDRIDCFFFNPCWKEEPKDIKKYNPKFVFLKYGKGSTR